MSTKLNLLRTLLAAILLCGAGGALGADLSVDDVDARLNEVTARHANDDALLERLSNSYAKAREFLSAGDRHRELAREFAEAIAQGPQRLRKLAAELKAREDELGASTVTASETELDLPALERLTREAESKLISIDDRLATLEARTRSLGERPGEIRAQTEQVAKRLETVERALTAPSAGPLDDTSRAANLLLNAEQISRRAELERLEQELLSHTIRSDIAAAEKAIAAAQAQRQSRRVTELNELTSQARERAAESVIEETTRAQDVAGESHIVVQHLLDENAAYGDELSQVLQQQSAVIERGHQLEQDRAALEHDFARAQERLKYAGYGTALGHLLIEQRRRIPNLRQLKQESERRKRLISEIGLRSIELDILSDESQKIEDQIEQLIANLDPPAASANEESGIRKQLEEGLTNRHNLFGLLKKQYSNYLQALGDSEFAAQQLATTVASYAEYLDKKITWIPNAPMLGLPMLIDSARGFRWLVSPRNWTSLLSDFLAGGAQRPIPAIAWAGVIALLIWARRALHEMLVQGATKLKSVHSDKFRYTLIAIIASLLLSLPLALAFLMTADVLRAAPNPTQFSASLAHTLYVLAPMLFVLQWLRRILRKDGLGRRHLRWSDGVAVNVRRLTTNLTIVFVPAYFLALFFERQNNVTYQYGAGRLAFIVAMLAMALYVYQLVQADGFLVKHLQQRYSTNILARFHRLVGGILLLMPLSFAVLAAIGFYYTALNLTRHMLNTGLLVLIAIVVHGVAMRWLMLAEARLALRRARQRREALIEANKENGDNQDIQNEELSIDIATVNSQTRMMLANFVGWAVALGLYFIWSGALPALGILESVHLWEIEVVGATGAEYRTISLATVTIAAIIVTVTYIAAKNLPGVLEIGLLQRLPLQAGSRYAVTTLSQYVITAVGITIALSALGARWSQIQWLVAALSVGLGFGLQEIVANFISGLILLFERPIRVGDTVTIGELTGKVSRIRIRATTIVDWDNKEILVPNKNFITERFVNWTLSDPVNRVKVRVGIAYGSNVTKALEIMHQAAAGEAKVLESPAPRALFLGFGDSSLDFEVQAYIRDINDRLPVTHALHLAINEGFAAAGVEIPFPQRDLHLRSIDAAADLQSFANLTTRPASD